MLYQVLTRGLSESDLVSLDPLQPVSVMLNEIVDKGGSGTSSMTAQALQHAIKTLILNDPENQRRSAAARHHELSREVGRRKKMDY